MPKAERWAGPLFEGHVCSLGYGVADWLQANTCHGPGDVQGEPLDLYADDEWMDFLVAIYRIDPHTGRRVYDEGVISRPKGRSKSELAGLIGIAEAFGPVRFDGWDASGQPVGRRVVSPLLKCLATEELQAGNTFENIAFIATDWGPDVHPEIYRGIKGARQYQSATALYLPRGGEIRASTSGSASKDGGKETFVVVDESHQYVLPELKRMYGTVRRNLGKRKLAEPWMLQTTTAYRAGEQSIAEETIIAWRKETLSPAVYVDHRQAEGRIRIHDRAHTMGQLRQVYGSAGAWIDLDRIYREMLDPRSCPDEATAARYFLNRVIATTDAWIELAVVERQTAESVLEHDEPIALGFDGSLRDDSTVLYASRMSDGYIVPIGVWSKPDGPAGIGWEVPRYDVKATLDEAFERYAVTRFYADPHEWRSDIEAWAEEYGEERVVPWETRRDVQMAAALDRVHSDLVNGVLWHSGDKRMLDHFGNAYVRTKGSHRLVRKEHPQSDRKIDSVIGVTLAYEARADAIAAGWTPGPKQMVVQFGPRQEKGAARVDRTARRR